MRKEFYYILESLDNIRYKEWCSIREEWCLYKDYIEKKFNESGNKGTLSASEDYLNKFLDGFFDDLENKRTANPPPESE